MRLLKRIVLGFTVLLAIAAIAAAVAWHRYTCTLPPILVPVLPELEAPTSTSPDDWRAKTLGDLAAIRRIVWEHTPIPYDAENPHYRDWTITGTPFAIERAERVTDRAGWWHALAAYVNGFGDPHIAIHLDGEPLPARWPGFIVARVGNAAEVVHRADEPGLPPIGARFLACDGESLEVLLASRVYPFRLNPRLARDRRLAMTRLFLDLGNPFAPAPLRCMVEINGAAQEIELAWRDAPPQEDPWWSLWQAAATGPSAEWGVEEPVPGVHWIGVPTFASGADTAPKLDALVREVSARGDAMRTGRAIVIDTRGNSGGNSQWADRLAEAIFGADLLDRHSIPKRRSAVDWRGSAGNAAFWREWSGRMVEEFGAFSAMRFGALFLAWQLERVADRDPPIWRQGDCDYEPAGGLTRERPDGPPPFPARVYFVSNGACGSSCLNFADRVMRVPGVRVIGSDTSGDGAYMEVRDETLPSGGARFTFPQKVYRGMSRGHLEAYEADILHEGPWDDASVRAFVLEIVDREAR